MAQNGTLNGSGSGSEGTFAGPLVRLIPSTPAGTGLVDQYGRPATQADVDAFGPPTDPIAPRALAGVIKRDIPIVVGTTWDITSIRKALQELMFGSFATAAFLFDAILGDDRVSATLGQRMGAVFSRPMKTTPSPLDTSGEVAEAWDRAWERFAPQSVLEEVQSWGIGLGAGLSEIQWDTTVTPWQPYLKPWHMTHVMYRWDLRKYQVATLDGVEIIEPGDGRWMLYTPHGPHRGWRRAAVRPIAIPWFTRQLAWRDWARYNERHGLAIIKAKSPARSDPKLRDAWLTGLATLGQESVVNCPQMIDGTGYDAEMLEAKDRSWESFQATIGRADMAIVLSMLWQNLTTEVDGGSYAAAKVHEGVKQSAARFDSTTLAHALYQQGARVFAAWNYGNPDLAPMRTWTIEEPSDHLTSSQTFQAFATAIAQLRTSGVQLTPAAVARLAFSFNIAITADDIEMVATKLAGTEDPNASGEGDGGDGKAGAK